MDVGWLRAVLTLDSAQFEKGIANAKTNLTQWRDETNKSTVEMGKWGAAIGAVVAPLAAAGAAVYSLQQKYGTMAQGIKDLSLVTGLSTDKIQQFQYAAVLSGDDFNTVAASLSKLSLSMAEARDNTSSAAQAFARLGVSPAGKSPDQVFEETANALLKMEDTTARNQIAMELYGKSYRDILPFMESYIQNQDEIQKSPTITEEELQNLEDAKVAWDKLSNSITIYTGKALAFVEEQYSADTLSKILVADEAFRKLGRGDVGGFFQSAEEYRLSQIQGEQQKMRDVIAANNARSGVGVGAGTLQPTGESATLKDLAENSKSAFDTMESAAKDYRNALEDVADARKKLADMEKNYQRELSTMNLRDVAGVRNLMIRHQWDVEDNASSMAGAEQAVQQTRGAYQTSAASYGKAAARYGDVIVKIGEREIARVMGAAVGQENRAGGIGVL